MSNEIARRKKSFHRHDLSWLLFIITCLVIGVLAYFGPAEHSLGSHIRVVYLHGAWVWVSIVAFLLAAIFGALGLVTRRLSFHRWSSAFGRTGILFWVTYLPISLWAMQSNWNGLFLSEPRWRLALVFAVAGSLLQVGLALINKPQLTSALNIGFFAVLFLAIQRTENVLHPVSPILNSDSFRIQSFFFILVLLIFLAAWQIARWWHRLESAHPN